MSKTKEIFKNQGLLPALSYQYHKIKYKIQYKMVSILYFANRALPHKYHFVYLSSHATGHNAMKIFLEKCGVSTNWHFRQTGYERYESIYNMLINSSLYPAIMQAECDFEDYEKFMRTIDAKVPALVLVRDPISILKSCVNFPYQRECKEEIIRGGGV